MALGKSALKKIANRNARMRILDVTGDAAYAAGGYALTPADFGFTRTLEAVIVIGGPSGFIGQWDHAAAKLKFFKVGAAGAMTETANNEATLNGAAFKLLGIGDISPAQ